MRSKPSCALMLALALLPIGVASAQVRSLQFTVDYFPDRTSAPYDFSAKLIAANLNISLIAPDGTLFEKTPGVLSIGHEYLNLTASNLTRFAGRWTINDYESVLTGALPKQHTFDVSIDQFTAHLPVPHLIAPVDGAILPPIFEINPSGGGFLLHRLTGTGGMSVLSGTPSVTVLEYNFPRGETRAMYEVRAYRGGGESRTVLSPAGSSLQFAGLIRRNTFSPPSRFTIAVPEPAAIVMGTCFLTAIAALRRRR